LLKEFLDLGTMLEKNGRFDVEPLFLGRLSAMLGNELFQNCFSGCLVFCFFEMAESFVEV
jgi:hypothetical protein